MVRVDPETEIVGLDYAHGHETGFPRDGGGKKKDQTFYFQSPFFQFSNSLDGVNMNEEEFYDELFEKEMRQYSQEYIEKPGWSHPVMIVLYDLSWLSVVRSRRTEMRSRRKQFFNEAIGKNQPAPSMSKVAPVELDQVPVANSVIPEEENPIADS